MKEQFPHFDYAITKQTASQESMHIVTVKVVRIINNVVISSFRLATYEGQLYAQITHNFTHALDRRQTRKKRINLSREKLHVEV